MLVRPSAGNRPRGSLENDVATGRGKERLVGRAVGIFIRSNVRT